MENWYVAKTRFFRGEIKMRDTLAGLGVEAFVPVRIGRKTRGHGVTRTPAVPNLVFLKATKEEACALVTERFLPLNYVVDCATRRMMVVPEKQMEDFRRVFDCPTLEGGLVDQPLDLGDRVRVTRGPLKGVEGNVVEFQGRLYVVVALMGCIFARARVPRAWLEKIVNN